MRPTPRTSPPPGPPPARRSWPDRDGQDAPVVVDPRAGALRRWRPGREVDLAATLSSLRRGPHDPTLRREADGTHWRTGRAPGGAYLLRLVPHPGSGEVLATAWGPGADAALDGVPDLLGERDDPTGFRPLAQHGLLRRAWALRPGWRVPRTGAVLESLVPAALEQVVTGVEAHRAFRTVVRSVGTALTGPDGRTPLTGPAAGMVVPPTPARWAQVPSWQWLRAGVEQRRSRVVVHAAGRAPALERTLALPAAQVEGALRSLPGVGVWTAAEVRHRAHGDPDAFSWADYHVSRDVSWALTGTVLDDAGCAEVIEVYRGHRYRVQRLLQLAGHRRPRRGPRRTLPTHLPVRTGGRS